MTATIKFIIAILIAMLQPNSNHQMLHTHFNYKSKQSAEALCIQITVFSGISPITKKTST